MGTPETIQAFEDILSDLPVVEIHQFANKIRSGIANPWEPIRYPNEYCVYSIF